MFEQKLTELLKDSMGEIKENKRTAFEKVMMFANEVLENTRKYVKNKAEGRGSSQGSEEQDKLDKEVFNKYFERHLVFMSDFKKVKMRVVELCCNGDMSLERKIKDSLYEHARKIELFELSSKNIEQALKEFDEKLKTMRPPTKLEVIEKALFDSKNAADPEIQREAAIGEKKIADEARQIEAAARQAERFANQAQARIEAIRLNPNIEDKEKQISVQAANTARQAADIANNIADELQQKTDLQLQEIQKRAKEAVEKQNIAKMALDEIIEISANHENYNSTDHKERKRGREANKEGETRHQSPSPGRP